MIRDPGSQYAWGTFISEEWDPEKHPDTLIDVQAKKSSKKPKFPAKTQTQSKKLKSNPDLVFRDPVRKSMNVVEDRWSPLTHQV